MPAGKQRGFTLLEILMAMLILMIMTSISVPVVQRMFEKNQLIADYNRFLAGLRQARSEAIRRQESVVFRIEQSDAWQFVIETAATEVLAQQQGRQGGVQASTGQLTFDRMGRLEGCDGELDDASECKVTLTLATHERSIVVFRTGRAGRADE